jgi:hypothetical protein
VVGVSAGVGRLGVGCDIHRLLTRRRRYSARCHTGCSTVSYWLHNRTRVGRDVEVHMLVAAAVVAPLEAAWGVGLVMLVSQGHIQSRPPRRPPTQVAGRKPARQRCSRQPAHAPSQQLQSQLVLSTASPAPASIDPTYIPMQEMTAGASAAAACAAPPRKAAANIPASVEGCGRGRGKRSGAAAAAASAADGSIAAIPSYIMVEGVPRSGVGAGERRRRKNRALHWRNARLAARQLRTSW